MSRGLGKVERQILNVLKQQAVGLAIPVLAEALPGLPVQGIRRAVQRLERQGQIKGTFQAVSHGPSWGGISRVKVVSLVKPKMTLQDGGASYDPGSRPGGYTRGKYLERARKRWQAMDRQGYMRLPGVRKREVYGAIGTVLHWHFEEVYQRTTYKSAQRGLRPTATFQADVQRTKAVWKEARGLLDQAWLQLTTLIKAPHINREQRKRPTDNDLKDRLGQEGIP
jgi:Replication protein A C terminal